ncbi:glycosyltransferase family 2 protein [Aquibium carbonis]|uniref:Glycosyltransferase family 2 protein n=1 Tax=Aquibium carbonis TaxID=2495581 RepID=A0A429YEW6_9HYPH|nr:glycosyltransferase family 2 protein [Aquibium carbonis]RST79956.1 glycosyltransferase family 2 protein [Aquibium carbonis]
MPSLVDRRPLVSICMPIYRSEAFIRETILSALGQTVHDVEIVISNDGAHKTPALDEFREHSRIRIFEPHRRLGWVENSNFVLDQARGWYFMILPHDDRLSPTYVEACLRMLEADPACFAAVSDIAFDGGVMTPSEVRGDLVDRVGQVMRNLYNGYSYRALMRRRPGDSDRLKLVPNPPTDFCVDTTWILQQAGFGELRRVPEALYWKAFPPTSTHRAWSRIPQPQLREAWACHCRQMEAIALSFLPDPDLVSELVRHRRDARRVSEAPFYLKDAMLSAEAEGQAREAETPARADRHPKSR